MKVLVTGDRGWSDYKAILKALQDVGAAQVIEGGAAGADYAAAWASDQMGIQCTTFRANWKKHGKKAGPLRNAAMLAENPDLVLAFHDDLRASKGTKDCIAQALGKGIDVVHFWHCKDGKVHHETWLAPKEGNVLKGA